MYNFFLTGLIPHIYGAFNKFQDFVQAFKIIIHYWKYSLL